MGKTESGAIWLDPLRTSPYAFHQYWMNVADEDAGKCLRFLTELEQSEVEQLDASRAAEPQKRASQQRLADELTTLVHGKEGLAAAERAKNIFFGGDLDGYTDADFEQIKSDVPCITISQTALQGEGMGLLDAMVETGLSKSKGEARRTVQQGGAYINNQRCGEIDRRLTADDLASPSVMVLRSGKKKYALLTVEA